MSSTQHDEEQIENARDPYKPWQIIAVIICIAIVSAVGYLFVRNGEFFWHRHPVTQLARSDGGTSQPYNAPPDTIEKAAFKPASQQQQQKAPPPPDESGEFNSPLMKQQAGAPTAPHLPPAPGPADTATASAMSNGSSLLLATAHAYRVPHPMFTIRKGTLIPCSDVTVLDTSAGTNVLVKGIIPRDVWSMDHTMVLLNKGTELLGEVGHAMVDGLDRIGIVWREATTPPPTSIGVSFDSPAAGQMGEGGLDGQVNRHEWQKIKGVLLFTLIESATNVLQSALASHGSTNINLGSVSTNGQDIGAILLNHMINIPDTIHRNEGEVCSAFLARDLDFSSVYSARIVK